MFGLKELERKEGKGIGGISNLLFGWLNERERKENGGKGKEMSLYILNILVSIQSWEEMEGKERKAIPPIIIFSKSQK